MKFADSKGAMGLCFDETGKQLLVMAEGWLSEYRDDNLDRVADGPPRKILPFASGEHGGHAIRRGPDGKWWVIGGNDAGIDERRESQPKTFTINGVAILPPKPIAGAIVRLSADLKTSEVWADGFRNPYDFDFNKAGDVFTFDSDCERDYFLPWYSGCRVYHAWAGRQHGWRLNGYQRSFRIPDYMPDTVPCLAEIGRGSPTGVHVYKGTAFPPQYQDSLFIEDWTFGRIHFLPLARPERSAGEKRQYVTRPEVFLEPIGTAGFAPTDLVETKDGALLVSIGGRKTRGAIFRIEAQKGAPSPALPVLAQMEPPPPAALVELAAAQASLGGWKLQGATADAFVPYEPVEPRGLAGEDLKGALARAEDGLFSLDDRVVTEAARLLAMLEDGTPRNADNILAQVTPKSSPTADFHFLACLARLRVEPTAERTAKTAHAILDLDRKLAGGDRRPKQMWPVRLNDVVARLASKDAGLAKALLTHSAFATPGHLPLVETMPADAKAEAAKLYLDAVRKDAAFEWSPELIKLVGALPDARPLLRAQWRNLGLRPAIRAVLQAQPSEADAALLAEKDTAPPVAEDPAATATFVELLKPVLWDKGDGARGEKLFRERACATCHAGTSPGKSGRTSRDPWLGCRRRI